jgi:hypothetical protein
MKSQIKSGLMLLLCITALAVKSQVPFYSSYPSATAVVFLDFDGQTVSGTGWNTNGPIYCGPSGLTNAQITEVFNRVSEDYRPFNVNITTDSTKYWAAPANMRMRVIVTVTSNWYGSAGGVAYVNSFQWGDDTPCFVFSALLNYNTKNVSEACSHEAGHTLGLRHQSSYDTNCVKLTEYNAGQGSGEIGWAPIMGVGYYQNFTLWHNGPNSLGCTSIQSDLDVITSGYNGFTYRVDDYGNTFAASYPVTFTNNAFNVNGVIERNTDVDMFKFTMPYVSRFKLTATPYNVGTGDVGSDLDMQVTLYNNSQVALGVYNPAPLLNAVIDTTLNPGNYYLKVEGKGNIYAPNYASLGSYSLVGQLLNSTLPVHKLQLKGTFTQDKRILNWTIEADELLIQQVLEISTDGRNFVPLVQPSLTDRSYTYTPANNSGSALYRLSVRFDNNSHYYSNVVTIKQSNDKTLPKVINTFVTNGTISVTSPGDFEYIVFDVNGKLLNKGKLTNGMNTISANEFVKGMYLLRFTDGQQEWAEKIVKQ